MQLKYNFIVKDVLEIQESKVFSERSEYKEREAERHFSGEERRQQVFIKLCKTSGNT